MLDKFRYLNSKGEFFDIGTDGVFANYNDLRDFEWDYDSDSYLIPYITTSVKQKSMPLVFTGAAGFSAWDMRNNFLSIVEYDLQKGQKGRLYVGNSFNGYYLECYISGASSSDYLNSDGVVKSTFKVITDNPMWHRETSVPITSESESDGSAFPFDFPIQLSQTPFTQFTNISDAESDFVMKVYGPCTNPRVLIDNHIYQVNATMADGDYLEINSANKTIVQKSIGDSSAETNMFNKRYKAQSIFQKIQSGVVAFSKNGQFDVELMLIENRSEPKWGW